MIRDIYKPIIAAIAISLVIFSLLGLLLVYVVPDAGREDKRLNPRDAPEISRPVIFTVLDLLWSAESSRGRDMTGDSGKARGHFQHWQSAWDYGTKQLKVDWPYSDADNLARAAAVTAACWSGQARGDLLSGNVEMLIRRHRLPNKPMRKDNDRYLKYVLTKGG